MDLKQTVPVLTKQYREYWNSLLEQLDNDAKFTAKLCYTEKDTGHVCFRVFPSELTSGKDLYMEFFDWDGNHYYPTLRKLYKLKFDATWKSQTDKYKEITAPNLTTPTYVIKVSDAELINATEITAAIPKGIPTKVNPMELFEVAEPLEEREDGHYSSTTIRDLYSIFNNVPLSNKPWLNDVIKEGRKWLNQHK